MSVISQSLIDDNQEQYALFACKVAYTIISLTNKRIGGSKVKAADLYKVKNDEEWKLFYEEHIEFFNLVCTEVKKLGFVLISKEDAELTDNEKLSLVKHSFNEKEEEEEMINSAEGDERLEDDFVVYENSGEDTRATDEQEVEQTIKDVMQSLIEMCPILNEVDNRLEMGDENHTDDSLTIKFAPSGSETEFKTDLSNLLASLSMNKPETLVQGLPSLNSLVTEDLNRIREEATRVCIQVDEFQQKITEGLSTKAEWQNATEDDNDQEEEIDPEFTKKLEEQTEIHRKRLNDAREKREQKKKEFEKELQDIRAQQKLCFATLLNCIILKYRFEEKEQEVASWIENCYKQPLVYLLRSFHDFDSQAREWKFFRNVPEDSVQDIRQEVLNLHERVLVCLDNLKQAFEQLEQLHEMSPEALFLKVLQKHICQHALDLHRILDVLEVSQFSYGWYLEFDNAFANLNPTNVPTTATLQRECTVFQNYEDVNFPERIIESSLVIEEEKRDFFSMNHLKETSHYVHNLSEKSSFITITPTSPGAEEDNF